MTNSPQYMRTTMTLPERILALEAKHTACGECSVRTAAFEPRIVAMEIVVRSLDDTRKDFETRLRTIERTVWLASGALGLLQIALKYLH